MICISLLNSRDAGYLHAGIAATLNHSGHMPVINNVELVNTDQHANQSINQVKLRNNVRIILFYIIVCIQFYVITFCQ